MLVLFDADGFGLHSDDDSGGGPFSHAPLISTTLLTPGTFYLALFSTRDYESPTSASGRIWIDIRHDLPDGPGAANPWIGWEPDSDDDDGEVDFGRYTIELNRATIGTTTVPEPGTFALFGLGLGAFGLLRRRA